MIPLAMTRSLRIVRLGSVSLERLAAKADGQGHVHSVFDRAINILWPDGRLLTLHGQTPLAAPFGVALSALPPREAVTTGTAVRSSDFDWEHAETVALEMPRGPLAFSADILPEVSGGRALASGAGLRARRALGEGLATLDLRAFVDAAEPLIGLGEGLTPAGDDCVLGALAAIQRLAPESFMEDRAQHDRLAEVARARTTDVARDFLLEALDGRFSEPVLALLTARTGHLADHAMRELLAMGATSGADTLTGIRLGCRALSASSAALA
jgi:Protein of unknown function (DUF2877)